MCQCTTIVAIQFAILLCMQVLYFCTSENVDDSNGCYPKCSDGFEKLTIQREVYQIPRTLIIIFITGFSYPRISITNT